MLVINHFSFIYRSPVVNNLLSTDKNIFVEAKECIKPVCNSTCELPECQLCRKCISEGFLSNIHSAYREHVHRGDMKRIFPIPMVCLHSISNLNN